MSPNAALRNAAVAPTAAPAPPAAAVAPAVARSAVTGVSAAAAAPQPLRPPPARVGASRPTGPRPEKKKRKRFTEAEDDSIIMGLNKHGLKSNKWRAIYDDTTLHLDPCRTTVDLKDRWRNLRKSREEEVSARCR